MAEYIEREALLRDIEQSVVYTARGKITSAEMRGAHKIIERIKCAPAVEPIYIHEPKVLENCERNGYIIPMKPDDFCSYGERKDGDNGAEAQRGLHKRKLRCTDGYTP